MAATERKCEHKACTCLVGPDDVFCSPHCEKRSDEGTGPPCGCGHSDCDMGGEIPVEAAVAI